MLLDSLIILASQEDTDQELARLQQLLHRLPSMYDILKSSLRDWTISLPRILQSNDDNRQKQYLSQISTAIKLLTSQEGALTVLNESLATTLQSSVQALLSPEYQLWGKSSTGYRCRCQPNASACSANHEIHNLSANFVYKTQSATSSSWSPSPCDKSFRGSRSGPHWRPKLSHLYE